MKIAYFDCSYGAAGDMILGALVDAGVSFEELKEALEKGLGVEGIRLSVSRVTRSGVTGTQVAVEVDSEHDRHRHLKHIVDIIEGSDFSRAVKDRAVDAYRRLAEAEAKVHQTTPEKIHFHEVGCLDAIADVAGSMFALERLGIDRVEVSPPTLGAGTARCAHGVIPVPAPATVEILRGIPTRGSDFAMEMTTPTGAAILTAAAAGFGPQPPMFVEAVGYGAGNREIEGHANFLRVFVGESAEGKSCGGGGGAKTETAVAGLKDGLHSKRLTLLMTEVDDMSPELLGDLMTRLFDAGCLDAHFTPIQMKKNRPATQIQVLCDPERRGDFIEIVLRHTSTFGMKVLEVERVCLPRRREIIECDLGPLEVKIGLWGDEVLKVTPEYESCRRLARDSDLPLSEVYLVAQAAIGNAKFGARDAE